jgi:hypothetical protein
MANNLQLMKKKLISADAAIFGLVFAVTVFEALNSNLRTAHFWFMIAGASSSLGFLCRLAIAPAPQLKFGESGGLEPGHVASRRKLTILQYAVLIPTVGAISIGTYLKFLSGG